MNRFSDCFELQEKKSFQYKANVKASKKRSDRPRSELWIRNKPSTWLGCYFQLFHVILLLFLHGELKMIIKIMHCSSRIDLKFIANSNGLKIKSSSSQSSVRLYDRVHLHCFFSIFVAQSKVKCPDRLMLLLWWIVIYL